MNKLYTLLQSLFTRKQVNHADHSHKYLSDDYVTYEDVPVRTGGHTTLTLIKCLEPGCKTIVEFGNNSQLVTQKYIDRLYHQARAQGWSLQLGKPDLKNTSLQAIR